MTAVTIQSNKIVSSEVQDKQVLLGPPYKENKWTFWPTQYFHTFSGYRHSSGKHFAIQQFWDSTTTLSPEVLCSQVTWAPTSWLDSVLHLPQITLYPQITCLLSWPTLFCILQCHFKVWKAIWLNDILTSKWLSGKETSELCMP